MAGEPAPGATQGACVPVPVLANTSSGRLVNWPGSQDLGPATGQMACGRPAAGGSVVCTCVHVRLSGSL